MWLLVVESSTARRLAAETTCLATRRYALPNRRAIDFMLGYSILNIVMRLAAKTKVMVGLSGVKVLAWCEVELS